MDKRGLGRSLGAIVLGFLFFCLLLAGVYWVSREGARSYTPAQQPAAAPKASDVATPVSGAVPYTGYVLWLGGAVFALGIALIAVSIVSAKRKKKILKILKDSQQQTDEYARMVFALCGVLENWDAEPGKKEHVLRVSRYSRILARLWGFPEQEAQRIGIYAMLHDIGMFYVPRSILRKNGSLTSEEYARVKKHVEYGYRYATRYGLPDPVRQIIRYHHEQWDGDGYHKGMAGPHIPLVARIVGLADTYDALRMERVYRPSYTHAEAVEVIREERRRMLDPALVDLFIEYHTLFEDVYSQEIMESEAAR
jgi:putative nucleotidyltransferase with HDIG domain